jgi:hypothetical protein
VWREYIKTYKSAKTFLIRSVKGVDKAMQNEAFTTWKNAIYHARK